MTLWSYMSNVTFDIERAPLYGQNHPGLYGAAFDLNPEDYEPRLPVIDIINRANATVESLLPNYSHKIYRLEEAISEKRGSCIARACLFQTLVSPFNHMASGVVIHRYQGVGSHWFNAVAAKKDPVDTVVDSYTVKPDEKLPAIVKLRRIGSSGAIYDNCYGGVKNTLQLLSLRRDFADFVTNQEELFMEDQYETGTDLKTIGRHRFEELASGHARGEYPNYLAHAVIYFNEMATAVVDVAQGDRTLLADRELAIEVRDLGTDKIFQDSADNSSKQLANV